ncbi:MAG: hypothetical protein U5K43_13560 [Halofilum sp. (in: g-proteobacteria)]|nr:hypothetical protein [Halofilum sp. (in: g-proteobacteria)]
MQDHGLAVTASMGVLTCRTAPASAAACLDAADRLMYRAKHDTGDAIACGVHDTAAVPGNGNG